MQSFSDVHIRLHGLVIFRNLLNRRVIQRLDALLCCDIHNTAACVDAYSSFAAALFNHTESFSRYLLKFMMEDENIYMLQSCRSHTASENMQACLTQEIAFLQQLSSLTSAEVQQAIGYNGFLPAWTTEDLDFAAAYEERIRELPKHGYGIFARYHIFCIQNGNIVPVKHPDPQRLSDLHGYEQEREKVIANTRALLNHQPAANVLLYGDAGTGKSSCVKAIANEFSDEGLRLIEVKKNQLYQIPDLVEKLSINPLKFILFIDDLSFSSNDDDFAALKAILEGSVGGHSENLVVYATSNRRHLVKESMLDRTGDDIHSADTMQELLSLSARFGLKVTFGRPDKDLYCRIVKNLAHTYNIPLTEEQILIRAEAHAIRNGGRSPRVAKQFVEQLAAECAENSDLPQ